MFFDVVVDLILLELFLHTIFFIIQVVLQQLSTVFGNIIFQ